MPKAEAEARKAWAGLRRVNRQHGLQFKLSLDDLIQAACEGMCKAGQKFDRARRAPGASAPVSFWSYASMWVHGEIMAEIRSHLPIKHLALVPLDQLCDFHLQSGSGESATRHTPHHERVPSMAPLMDGSDGDGAVSDRWPAADLAEIMAVITAWKDRQSNPERAGQIVAALQDGKSYSQIAQTLNCSGSEARTEVQALIQYLRAELVRAGFSSDKELTNNAEAKTEAEDQPWTPARLAVEMGVSARWVRNLLAAGEIAGTQDARGAWTVSPVSAALTLQAWRERKGR